MVVVVAVVVVVVVVVVAKFMSATSLRILIDMHLCLIQVLQKSVKWRTTWE